ncbi:MAG: TPM domain-containing protein [Candidatus Gracilibacteria bacterium]|nr:TPM domain-containing protein [Candidatus Gracilibacteria bacterium]
MKFFTIASNKPEGFLLDQGGVFSDKAVEIGATLRQISQETESEVYIVTVDSLPTDYNLLSFTVDIFNRWEVNQNKGMLFAIDVSKNQIEMRYSQAISDLVTPRGENKIKTKYFKQAKKGNYDEVFSELTLLLGDVLSGDEKARKQLEKGGRLSAFHFLLVPIWICICVYLMPMPFQYIGQIFGVIASFWAGKFILVLFYFGVIWLLSYKVKIFGGKTKLIKKGATADPEEADEDDLENFIANGLYFKGFFL